MGRPKKTGLETSLLEATGQTLQTEALEDKEPKIAANLSNSAFSTLKKNGKYHVVVIKYDPDTGETGPAEMKQVDSYAEVIEGFKLGVAKSGLLKLQE